MIDLEQKVKVRWYSGNKKKFVDLGYEFTSFDDYIEVPLKYISKKSHMKVNCICDYCGKEYITQYGNYNTSVSRGKCSCRKCKQLKIQDSLMEKYGQSSLWAIDDFRHKAKESMKEKYGAEYALQTQKGRNSFEKSMEEKYNVSNPAFDQKLVAKARASCVKNGKAPTSIPEQKMIAMLQELYGEENCKPSYPVGSLWLDCLLEIDGMKIDCEYDGAYWHKGNEDYDRRRNHWLISLGYKVMRIKGGYKDKMPTKERIKEEIDYLRDNHDLGYIDMNN